MYDKYKERYNLLYGNNMDSSQAVGQKMMSQGWKLNTLVQLLSDEDSDTEMLLGHTDAGRQWCDLAKPWLQDFHKYLQMHENVGDLLIVQWWGINAICYQVWASLADNYLSVMASSVSSERIFSSAGITTIKQHNHLKADIVKALQCMKGLLKKDLLFREDLLLTSEIQIMESCRRLHLPLQMILAAGMRGSMP